MDSYIIRIYRRNSGSPQDLVGLVELVELDEEKAFMNFEELREILNRKQGQAARKVLREDGEKMDKWRGQGFEKETERGEIV